MHEGQPIPEAPLRIRTADGWTQLPAKDFCANKTIVVFALPGAFTPTCSRSHLPRFDALTPSLRERGVDEVVCVAVNDTYVMDAWAQKLGVENVRIAADGNGTFTAAMGQLVDRSELGFGRRSWRYSMLVRDGVIEKMFVEPRQPGDPYSVSNADTMLRYLDSGG